MAGLNSAWMIVLLGIALLLGLLYFAGHKTVHTEILIPAAPEKIWEVLSDVQGYSSWNPVLVPISGEFKVGEKIQYRMIQPDGKESEVESRVIEVISNEKLNQFGGIRGILTFDHTWLLEPAEGGTKVTQHEEYKGIGVLFWDPGWVEISYTKANESLKDRVTKLQQK